ncbi:hypothetical protein G4M65_001792 [Campylobacter coli]|nr:hypothetical protein [Campylobacter coli]
MNTNKITDLHIQISKEDLKILDLLLKANEYSNIVFYCENDEEHFIFTEVKFIFKCPNCSRKNRKVFYAF